MRQRNLFLPYFAGQSLRFDPSDNYLYLNNAKSGCTTVKASLRIRHMEKNGQPVPETLPSNLIHGRGFWTYDYERLAAARPFTFSAVRNPFTRVLSAYLTKIGRRTADTWMRPRFCHRHGFAHTHDISFKEFLRKIDGDDIVQDQHWRLQVENLYVGSLPIDMAFPLERMADHLPELEGRIGFAFKGGVLNQKHSSQAQVLAEHYDDEAEEIVRRIYRRDFEAFGYSDRLSDFDEAPPKPLVFEAAAPADSVCFEAVGALHNGGHGRARELLEPHVESSKDIIQRLLLCEALLESEPVKEVRKTVAELETAPEAGQPIVRLMLSLLKARIAKVRAARKAKNRPLYRSALAELDQLATYMRLPDEPAFRSLRRQAQNARKESRQSALEQTRLIDAAAAQTQSSGQAS